MQKLVDAFIRTTNTFDVEGALVLFTFDAVIDDVSVGDAFVGTEGIRLCLERFFVGYKTTSKLLPLKQLDNFNAVARLDSKSDFGHEIGALKITINPDSQSTSNKGILWRAITAVAAMLLPGNRRFARPHTKLYMDESDHRPADAAWRGVCNLTGPLDRGIQQLHLRQW